ncbi:MAG: YbaN family protein [Planctomycetaceae bacterium]|nr:YbaN family protein [Planctomycetaceae bacterium]
MRPNNESSASANRLPPEPLSSRSAPDQKPPQLVHGVKRVCYLSGAGLCFLLGVLGALLPGLPATPFLLLTSFFLVRTSPRWNAALLRSRLFGPILRDWQENGGIRPHVKLKAVIFVVAAVGLTVTFSSLSLWPKVSVGVLAGVGIGVIARLPSVE